MALTSHPTHLGHFGDGLLLKGNLVTTIIVTRLTFNGRQNSRIVTTEPFVASSYLYCNKYEWHEESKRYTGYVACCECGIYSYVRNFLTTLSEYEIVIRVTNETTANIK